MKLEERAGTDKTCWQEGCGRLAAYDMTHNDMCRCVCQNHIQAAVGDLAKSVCAICGTRAIWIVKGEGKVPKVKTCNQHIDNFASVIGETTLRRL